MIKLKPETRLALCALIIIFSAAYAVLVAYHRELAVAITLWYVPVILTILVVVHFGKENR